MNAEVMGLVGPQGNKLADGVQSAYRLGITGEAIGSLLNSRYAEQSARGCTFTVATTGSTAISMGNSNSTGLILTNPSASGKNFVLLEIGITQAMVPGGAAPLMLAFANGSVVQNPNGQTALTIRPTAFGSPAASVAQAAVACWIPNSTPVRAIGGGPVAASSVNGVPIKDDIGGAIVLAPGNSMLLQSFTTQIGVLASYTWSEIPI